MSLPSDLKSSYDHILNAVNTEQPTEPIEPFWSKKPDDNTGQVLIGDAKTLDWMCRAIASTEMDTMYRLNTLMINRMSYRASSPETADPTKFKSHREPSVNVVSKINVPDQYRYVENITSRLLRFKAATLPAPTTNEFSDKQDARVAKQALMSIADQFDFDAIDRRMIKRLPQDGESFLLVLWNKDKGGFTERFKKAKKKFGDKKTKMKAGWTYDPKKPEYIGDFDFVLPQPWELRFDPSAAEPKDCQWVFYIKHQHVEEIILDYPEKEAEIRASANNTDWLPLQQTDPVTSQNRIDNDRIPKICFWHRKHKAMPFGKYIEAVPNVILCEKENCFSEVEVLDECPWGDLPVESLTDIDIEGYLHGYASLNLVNSFTRIRNSILSSATRNLLLHASPKLMVHANAGVSIEALNTGTTIIKWNGTVAPELKNFASIPPEIIAFYELLGKEQERSTNMHPISGGEPPKGITAGVALRLLEQIEDRLFEPQIKKMNRYVISRDKRILAMMGKFYKPEDKRMVYVVGEDNTDIIETLDVEVFQKKYNVRLEPVGPGSQSAAARKQDVLDLLQYGAPNTLSPEQVLDALELNRPEKITDPAQTAVANAERVIELVAQGKDFPMPRQGENYEVKWNIFMGFYQRQTFSSLPQKQQDKFIKMVTVLEYLMDEQALKNPMYDQILMRHPQWPAFYHPSPRPPAPMPPQQGEMPAAGAEMMNPGDSFTPQPTITNDQLVS